MDELELADAYTQRKCFAFSRSGESSAQMPLLREMLAGYSLGMWFTIPWFLWRGRRPETLFAVLGNILFSVAMIPEAKAYLEKRRSGELGSVSSWKEFFTSYPALTTRRQSDPAS